MEGYCLFQGACTRDPFSCNTGTCNQNEYSLQTDIGRICTKCDKINQLLIPVNNKKGEFIHFNASYVTIFLPIRKFVSFVRSFYLDVKYVNLDKNVQNVLKIIFLFETLALSIVRLLEKL
jgi:hypothetical protein